MLGKLLKYELKAMGRIMLPLYGAILAASVVLAFSMRMTMTARMQSLLEKLAILSSILLVVTVAASIVVMVILTLQRFYKNLLGNEGYLMFTLPVTTADNILSKLISAMVWVLLGIATGVGAGLLMIIITSSLPELMRELESVWKLLLTDQNQALVIREMILFGIMLICGILATICKVYAAMAIGHQWSDHRLGGAVLAYIGIGFVEILLSRIPGVKLLFETKFLYSSSSFGAFAFGIIICLLQAAFYAVITWLLLDRRLNLE